MNAYYQQYISGILNLSATLVIKSEQTADLINERLKDLGHDVDRDYPETWKYYKNLFGEYHVTNEEMTVQSLDTRETIPFTKASLVIHRGTLRGYKYGSRYYKELVARYPDQEMLIKGIINPIPIPTALAATDHSILFYDTTLVEPNEQQLIPRLQKFITDFFFNVYNTDYSLFEPYYYPGVIGLLYSKLPMEIINVRKDAVKTDMAHSFHIRQYLTSFSEVGKEFDFMTQKQRLSFYRNIRYFNLNVGRTENFETLTQLVLTERGFSLAAYEIAQDYEKLPGEVLPDVQMIRRSINGIEPAQGNDVKTVGEVLDMELALAIDNPVVRNDTEAEANFQMSTSLFNRLQTKVLESNVLDTADSDAYTLSDTLMNNWIYLSNFNMYKTIVTFTNPANGDTYQLTMKNAFILYLYAYNRQFGIKMEEVPVLSANRVVRSPLPTFEELRNASTKKRVPDYYIDYILDQQLQPTTYLSVDAFREYCVASHRVMLSLRDMRHFNQDYKAEGELHTIIDRCYMDIRIDLAESISYDLWFEQMGIDLSSIGDFGFSQIAKDLLQTATGEDLSSAVSMRAVHASMIRIMRALSSYTVQYIPQINDSPIKALDGKFPKLSLPHSKVDVAAEVEVIAPIVIDSLFKSKAKKEVKVAPCAFIARISEEKVRQTIPVNVEIRRAGDSTVAAPIEALAPTTQLLDMPDADISTIVPAPSLDYTSIPLSSMNGLVKTTWVDLYDSLSLNRLNNFLGI